MSNNRCPNCNMALTSEERKGAACPVCGQAFSATAAAASPEAVTLRPAMSPPPLPTLGHFHGLAVFACKKNRIYRVYLRPDEIVFIWAGSPAVNTAHMAGQGGLIGGLVGAMMARSAAKKNQSRQEVLDATPLEDLIGDHPMNVRAALVEFEEVRLAPRSRWRTYTMGGHQAILTLRHRTVGKYFMEIATVDDVHVAVNELPRLLGDVCRVEIEWSERDKKFIKRST